MSTKSTIAMVAVLAILIGVYFVWGASERALERREQAAKRVFEFDAEAIQDLTIEQDGAKPVSGRRDGDTWVIERPEGVPANPMVWDRIANTLAALSNERTVTEDPEDVAEYELAPPLLTVSATLTDGQTIRFTAGGKDPFEMHRYARVDDNEVFLITEDTFFELDRSLLWLRDRDLVTAGEDGIRRIEFTRYAQADSGTAKRGDPSKAVVVERNEDDGYWMLVEPIQGVADQGMVDALVQEVRFAKGRGYIDNPEDLDDYGLEVPGAGLTVYPYGGAPQTIFVGNATNVGEGEAFVRQEGRSAVFLVSAHMISLFPKSPDAFLEKRILAHPGSDLKAIDFAWGDTDIRLELDERRRWKIVRPIQDTADEAAVSELIGGLVSIVGAGYVTNLQHDVFGFSDPAMLVRLEIEGKDEPQEIRVGILSKEGRYLVTQAAGGATTVLQEEIDALMFDLFHFREKRLFGFQPGEVARVNMRFRGDTYAFEIRGGRWTVRAPEGLVWETQSDMELLLSTIANVRYEAIESATVPEDVTPYGIDDPTLEFSASVTEDGAVREVGPFRVGNPAEDDAQLRFATLAGRPELFRVPQSVIDGIEEARRGLVEK